MQFMLLLSTVETLEIFMCHLKQVDFFAAKGIRAYLERFTEFMIILFVVPLLTVNTNYSFLYLFDMRRLEIGN